MSYGFLYFSLLGACSPVLASCATVQPMASRSINKAILLGHLGKDAETKFTPSGVAKTTFTLATSRRWKDQQTGDWKEETEWHNVTLWRSENLANYLQKGKQVYVEGRISTRSYEDKDGNKKYFTEIVADDVILLGGRGDRQRRRQLRTISASRCPCLGVHRRGLNRFGSSRRSRPSIRVLRMMTFRFEHLPLTRPLVHQPGGRVAILGKL